MSNVQLLFYSRKCKYCKNLFDILQKDNILSYFKLICIDDSNFKRPPYITKIPTIILGKQLLVAEEAFNWANNRKNKNEDHKLLGYCPDNLGTFVNKDKDDNSKMLCNIKDTENCIMTMENNLDNIPINLNQYKKERANQSSFFEQAIKKNQNIAIKKYEDEFKYSK